MECRDGSGRLGSSGFSATPRGIRRDFGSRGVAEGAEATVAGRLGNIGGASWRRVRRLAAPMPPKDPGDRLDAEVPAGAKNTKFRGDP